MKVNRYRCLATELRRIINAILEARKPLFAVHSHMRSSAYGVTLGDTSSFMNRTTTGSCDA